MSEEIPQEVLVTPDGAPHVCPVCGKTPDKLSKIELKRILQLQDPANWGLCEKDQKQFDEGYIALIEVHMPRDQKMKPGQLMEKDVSRTGKIVHLRREIAEQYFQVPIGPERPLAYISHDVVKGLRDWMKHVYSQRQS